MDDLLKQIKEAKGKSWGYLFYNDDYRFKKTYKNFALIEMEELKEANLKDYYYVPISKRQAFDLLDITNINARIEPGAIIRSNVRIKEDAIVMMGAIINIGAEIGNKTLIDMGAVIGSRAKIGNNCHIGANAVVAGVLEPLSSKEVVIEDDCLIGAGAIIIEGVTVKKGTIVGAGSVVIADTIEGMVYAGNPARLIKKRDEKTNQKTVFLDELRRIE